MRRLALVSLLGIASAVVGGTGRGAAFQVQTETAAGGKTAPTWPSASP